MTWKRLTFIIIPHSQSHIRQLHVPRVFVFGAAGLMVLAIGVMIFYILGFEGKGYYTKRTGEITRMNESLEENLAVFDSTLAVLRAEVDSIDAVNRRIMMDSGISQEDLHTDDGRDVKVSESGLRISLDRVYSLIDRMETKSAAFEYNFGVIYDYCMEHPDELSRIPSIRPAAGFILKEFGRSFDEMSKTWRLNPGVDIHNDEGTPIVATAEGVIETVATSSDFGRYIVIDHGNGYKTRYTHLQTVPQMEEKIRLETGDEVKRGDRIGSMGRTGSPLVAEPAHVMYSVLRNGVPVNPIDYFFASDFADGVAVDMSQAHNL